MPIYEYQCRKCGHRFERMQRMADPHPTNCPDCNAKNSVEQLLSAPAVQFKGSGWYATDYAKKPSAAPAKSGESKAEVKAESGGDKTEKKSETKKSEPEKKQ